MGRFKDESSSDYSVSAIEEQRELPATKRAQLQYSSLETSTLVQRDLDSFSEEQKQKAFGRYKLLSLINKDLEGGWTPKNLEPLIKKHIGKTSLKKPSYKTI
ncbi:hypothetical protein [Vibrio aestuarianus]|uniref:hypothetical protein n=1 Tax=Vibrio aestuarianus TaxID=28171 RepID=UPI00237CF544|nr:hypothetical protein [Vibrio aestuarianus]MDE1211840.1 hypothetical protein [Vibrio aestuarianus]MDE1319824.1 hypothetical protein [Vibrio aestuarianus]